MSGRGEFTWLFSEALKCFQVVTAPPSILRSEQGSALGVDFSAEADAPTCHVSLGSQKYPHV